MLGCGSQGGGWEGGSLVTGSVLLPVISPGSLMGKRMSQSTRLSKLDSSKGDRSVVYISDEVFSQRVADRLLRCTPISLPPAGYTLLALLPGVWAGPVSCF